MLIQLANILGGALLAAPFIIRYVTHTSIDSFFKRISLYQAEIGVGVLLIGFLALIERLGIFFFNINLGSSFPQALPAIAVGLLLGYPLLKKFGFLESIVSSLERHKVAIGLAAIVVGVGSLLFGCVSPIGCPGGAIYYSI